MTLSRRRYKFCSIVCMRCDAIGEEEGKGSMGDDEVVCNGGGMGAPVFTDASASFFPQSHNAI